MKRLLVLTLLTIISTSLVWSQELESSAITGGGGLLEDDNGSLFDIKCTPFSSGLVTDGTGWMGINGVYKYFYFLPGAIQYSLSEGAVILSIERVADSPGSAIRVSWALNPDYTTGNEQVDIYYFTGNGTGQYPDDFVQKIITNDSLSAPPPGVTMDGSNAFLWPGQVGGGDPEIYFKGCITGKADQSGPMGLDGNIAVGKVDMLMKRKPNNISYNSFAINLLPEAGDTFDSMFPAYSFVAIDPTLNKLDADQIRAWDGTNWIAYFKSDTTQSWRSVMDPNEQATGQFAGGYVVRLQPANAPGAVEEFSVTTVGKVLPAGIYQSDVSYAGHVSITEPIGPLAGPLKYTSFGNPYPKLASFNDAFTINLVAGELTKATTGNKLLADQIRYWDGDSGNWFACYLASDNTWKLNANDEPAFDLMIGTGYFFRKADGSNKGEFIWKY
jgi:hypothetical protein